MYLYVKAFKSLEMGSASAMAWILFVVSAVLIALLMRRFSWESA
jgi:ABC-type sugar transport system permease subunit